MTTVYSATCVSQNCAIPTDVCPLSLSLDVPVLAEETSKYPVASQSLTFDDYDEDASNVFRYSPASVRTLAKESSPGSCELLSMPSEKSNSRGCSGDGSTGWLVPSEVTEMEHSASESSLSPCFQRNDYNNEMTSPVSVRLEDSVPSTFSQNSSAHPDVMNAYCSVVSPQHTTLSQSTFSSSMSSIKPTSSAFTPPYSSTPIHDRPFPGHSVKGCSYSHSFRTVIPKPLPDPSLELPTQPNAQNGPLLIDSDFRSHSAFPPRSITDASSSQFVPSTSLPLHSPIFPWVTQRPQQSSQRSEACSIAVTLPTTMFTSCPLNSPVATFSTFRERSTTQSVSNSLPFSRRVHWQLDAPLKPQCDSSVTCEHLARSSALSDGSPHLDSNQPFSEHVRQTPTVIINSVESTRYFSPRGMRKSTVTSHPRTTISRSSHSREMISNGEHILPSTCANSSLPLSDSHSKQRPIFDSSIPTYALQETADHTKRSMQFASSSRNAKKRRLVDRAVTSISVGNSSIPSFRTFDSRFWSIGPHQYIHDPVISFPATLNAPVPTPIHDRRCAKLEDGAPVTSNDCSVTPPTGIRNNKYSTFPMFPSRPQNFPTTEPQMGDFLAGRNHDRTVFHKLIQENLFFICLRKASFRSSQSCISSCPPTPPPDALLADKLLECLGDVRDCGRTTPPLNLIHKCIVSSKGHGSTKNTDITKSVVAPELFIAESLFCAYCALQLVTNDHVLNLKAPDGDGRILFCSFFCLTAYHNSGALKEVKINGVSHSSPVLGVTSLLSDLRPSLVILLQQHANTKWPKKTGKRSNYQSKFSRRRPSDSVNYSRSVWNRCSSTRYWHGIRWKKFSRGASCTRLPTPDAVVQNSPSIPIIPIRNPPFGFTPNSTLPMKQKCIVDRRVCMLCHKTGDAPNDISGRLLHYDYNKWLHLNCILWCYDTYETVSGSLVQVSRALEKAERTLCAHCGSTGAGLPCFYSDCQAIYHVPCAHSIGCSFHTDRGMYCPLHREAANKLCQLNSLSVERRVFISRDESSQVAGVILQVNQQNEPSVRLHGEDSFVKLRVGGLILHSVGQLLPEHLSGTSFHSAEFIYPVGYSSTRIYWSYRHVRQRCLYHCRIEDSLSKNGDPISSFNLYPKFIVQVDERDEPLEIFEDTSCDGVWQQILTRINQARRLSGLSHLRIIQNQLRGELLFGLAEPHIVRAIESLPGVDRLSTYIFKFGRLQLFKEMPLAINPTGCARSEPKLRTHVRRRPTGDASQHGQLRNAAIANPMSTPVRSGLSSPVYSTAASFLSVSKSQQYRRLRLEWRYNVILARSQIQGLGLYAARNLSKHAFIIEYLGELIRNEVGNRRERLYELQNRGIYMFRVDEDSIVDATMCGGLARYINHSCEPNCTAEVLNCENGSHIIIIASRDIEKGEELTYDYKFDIEEERGDRIPCLCGAPNCRRWMN
ncbi:histone-lysine N-methyltransferase MLL3 [Clonorchis sinensis]|uniref:Histone-lysine N-methyltransferase MLL3 n=1 Tax=Clonorchis sinensis TaxID=79923 RepID=H2KVV5_CLOSI|nr:histone-lysine N-methyltransferase MLL3 [Clonorchis sinensis]